MYMCSDTVSVYDTVYSGSVWKLHCVVDWLQVYAGCCWPGVQLGNWGGGAVVTYHQIGRGDGLIWDESLHAINC